MTLRIGQNIPEFVGHARVCTPAFRCLVYIQPGRNPTSRRERKRQLHYMPVTRNQRQARSLIKKGMADVADIARINPYARLLSTDDIRTQGCRPEGQPGRAAG